MDTIDVPREEMIERVATFTDLTRSVGGFPDRNVPGCERTLLDVIGFAPRKAPTSATSRPSPATVS
ncbi:hypothetical protein [Pseudonocardia sp.]|uniref:hypothetical protein n=1 Tax=Pseudonocardia sp. TaxID=60912 RepID=UPI003D0B33CA